jgi:hypothetical protein
MKYLNLNVKILLLMVTVLGACKNNAHQVDVSKIVVDLKPERYDKAFFAIDTNNVALGLQQISKQHPWFTDLFTEYLTGWGKYSDTATQVIKAATYFLTYKDYVGLNKTVQDKFPNTKNIDEQLTNLVKHIKHYDKDYKTPKLYYFNSGLNIYNAVTYDTIIAVGLDMFLGKDYEFYPSVQLPQYQINTCESEYIPIRMAGAIYQEKHPFDPNGKSLLALLIEKGKEIYYTQKVLPDAELQKILGFTPAQMTWIEKNEAMCWNYFIQQQLLYDTDFRKIVPYVTDGPSAQGMPPESPGNIGAYIGYQIVKGFAEKNSDIDLKKLVNQTIDPQLMLQESGYKPR